MLVLSRKTKETILIGKEVTIEVIRIQGNLVRLGITAPQHIKVLRGELAENSETETLEKTSIEIDIEIEDGAGNIEIDLDFSENDDHHLPENYPCTD